MPVFRKPNVLTVLLEYIDLGKSETELVATYIKQAIGRGTLPFTTLHCYISF